MLSFKVTTSSKCSHILWIGSWTVGFLLCLVRERREQHHIVVRRRCHAGPDLDDVAPSRQPVHDQVARVFIGNNYHDYRIHEVLHCAAAGADGAACFRCEMEQFESPVAWTK
eukprot:scpid48322/ scgid29273/ 